MLQSKTLTHNQSSITLYPERGGIITSMRIRDTELLYQGMLDETFHDRIISVRGGIPILFPNAGFLTDIQKETNGWHLPQHGFARTNVWKLQDSRHCEVGSNPGICHAEEGIICPGSKQESDSSSVGMTKNTNQIIQTLSSTDVPDMFGYDWQGTIENTITLSDESIEFRYTIANDCDKELPISFGLHPYFAVPLGDKSQIQWNFAGGDIIARDIEDWSQGGTTRIDMPEDGIIRVFIPGIGNLELYVSPDFHRLWIWSLPDKDFVCIEPMQGDDGNIVENPVIVPEGGKSESVMRIGLL